MGVAMDHGPDHHSNDGSIKTFVDFLFSHCLTDCKLHKQKSYGFEKFVDL